MRRRRGSAGDYDANGNRGAITYPSSCLVKYTFDFADRPLTACSGGTGPTCTGGVSYVSTASYQPFGPESSLSYGNGTTRTMTYDSRYRPSENKLVNGAGTIARGSGSVLNARRNGGRC